MACIFERGRHILHADKVHKYTYRVCRRLFTFIILSIYWSPCAQRSAYYNHSWRRAGQPYANEMTGRDMRAERGERLAEFHSGVNTIKRASKGAVRRATEQKKWSKQRVKRRRRTNLAAWNPSLFPLKLCDNMRAERGVTKGQESWDSDKRWC